MKGQPHDRNVEKGRETEENRRKRASLGEKERGREWWGEQWAPEAVAGIEAMAAAATVANEDRRADPDSGEEEFSGCRTDGHSSTSGTLKNAYLTSNFCVFQQNKHCPMKVEGTGTGLQTTRKPDGRCFQE